MDKQEFVDAIKIAVSESAVTGTFSALEKPPGKRPSAELIENAAWYSSLNDDEKKKCFGIVKGAVDQAVFGFLCVIDGVRAIESGGTKGRLQLLYVNDQTTILNSPDGEMLHDLY